MPGKHVRFSRNATVHTFSSSTLLPPPPPPPLTFDSHSPASTSSLLTPPDYPITLPPSKRHSKHLALPIQRVHSTHHASSSPRLHPLLEDSSSPDLLYDIRLPPTQLGSKRRIITPEEFSDPAVSPRVSSMTIIHKYLSWSIHVKPSGYSPSRGMYYVTVWDVLNALHSSLRSTIHQRDYDNLGSGSRHQLRVGRAYEDRYALHPRGSGGYQSEKMGGVRRIDFLVEYVNFLGLSMKNVERGEYILHTGH